MILAVLLASLLLACGGGGEGSATNVAPLANAGAARTVTVGSTVQLDASGSSDSNGDALSYTWTLSSKPAGSAAALDNSTAAKPHFAADLVGAYVASLKVNDGRLDSAVSSVTIIAMPSIQAPIANAGKAQNVLAGTLVTLDGSASSASGGQLLSYSWALSSRPGNSTATLSDANTAAPSFTADIAGTYVAALVVNDGSLGSAPATISVTASTSNVAPVADAGLAQNVLSGATVALNGAASSDANGDTLSFAWTLASKPAGSNAALRSANAVAPRFTADLAGMYVASLVVGDGKTSSSAATVTITASAGNVAPVANAGTPQSVQTGTLVTLDGAGSSDANGDRLGFSWTLKSKPSGSTAALAGSDTAAPTFIADAAGSYVAKLMVSDGLLNSAASSVSVTAGTANVAPVANAGAAQSVVAGSVVTLNGSASTDDNGDSLSFAWTLSARPDGSSATLIGGSSTTPAFTSDLAGTYVATLVVNDGLLSSAPGTVSITASVGNATPVANAGKAQTVGTGSIATLDGSASSDANGDTLRYAWTFGSRPAGSAATLDGASTATPSFTADAAGTYVALLVVNDGQVDSAAATVTVTARVPQSGLPAEELMATAAFGDVEFDWGRDGMYCGSCNAGDGNARFNWVDRGNRLWVANIDPDTGAVSPQDGKGRLVDNQAAYFADYGNGPEWVFSQQGSALIYSRYLAGEGLPENNPRIGYATQANGVWSATTLETGAARNLPAPTQTVADAVPRFAYGDPNAQAMYWRLLSSPPSAEARTLANSIGLSIRWRPGTGQFVYADGVPNPVDGRQYQQIKFYDTDTGAPPQQLTFDATQKRGAFMFAAPEYGGDTVFFTVADRTQLRVYRKLVDNTGSGRWQVVNTIVSPNPAYPYIATPEPFFYNGKWWVYMILSNSKAASDISVPTVMAVTGIDPAVSNIRMLQDETSPVRLRQDPEYFITSQGAYIYFSRAVPANDTSGPVHDGYYRVDTGLGPPQR